MWLTEKFSWSNWKRGNDITTWEFSKMNHAQLKKMVAM